jgi:hypothetical protein
MEQKSNFYWFLGITLDKYSNKPNDKIEMIDFYNSYNKKIYAHFNTSYEKKSGLFRFKEYAEEDFDNWKNDLSILIPLKNEKVEQMKKINTANHKSLSKFLKAFGFEEYII